MGPRWQEVALVGFHMDPCRSKLRSKVKFFNFVPFSRLINFVRQRRKTAKKRGKWYTNHSSIKQTEKSLGPVGSVFLIIF